MKAAGRQRERWTLTSSAHTEKQISMISSSYRTQILNVFEVIELDGESAIGALRREACRIAPASTTFDTKGTGARDAAIWLSLIRKATGSPEVIFFISSDKQAFKDVKIAVDRDETTSSVVVVGDIGELLEVLADDVDVDVSQSLIKESEAIRQRVSDQLINRTGILGNVIHVAIDSQPNSSLRFFSYHDSAVIKFVRVEEVRGHAIDSNGTWATGRVRWAVSFQVPLERHVWHGNNKVVTRELWTVSFQIVSTLLFKVAGENENLEILDFGKPSQITGQLEELSKIDAD
jgi:hypothetical protein